MINCKLTKAQYIFLRRSALSKGVKIYPPYSRVMKAKEECYPTQENIHISENSVHIDLQSLLDQTTKRLAEVQKEVISEVLDRSKTGKFTMIHKWGTDGSSGHSLYSQKFSDPTYTDSDILQTSLVPLQLQYETLNGEKMVIWNNPRPSSTRLCRPIRFKFCKETERNLIEEMDSVERQLSELQDTTLDIDYFDCIVQISHIMHKTMIDGKVCNFLAGNKSAQVCYICGVSPKNINNLDEVQQRPSKEDNFSYGLSTLHARIRFLECILHISYRLDIKKWRAPKGSIDARKKTVIDKIKCEMGLLIDVVIQGKGTSNSGNVSRRFFSNPTKASKATGVNEDLIRRFSVVLDTICSGYDINIEAFKQYALETAQLYVSLYMWYPMPALIHKILIHSADVMESILCPIGILSEEALEARHKEYRFFRRHHARKMSRIDTNEDLIHALLVSSDPIISALRPLPKRKLSSLSKDVLSLLEVKRN